jgi:hypothetical protein
MIVIGVPGPWEDFGQLFEAVRQVHGSKYLVSSHTLWETASEERCDIEIQGFDERLADAFRIAGRGGLSDETLNAIGGHKLTVYAVSDDASYEDSRRVARFVAVLLQAGGYAVKVESAGVAHEKETWLAEGRSENPIDIYSLFISMVAGDGYIYSCGMHNFGLPDAAVEESLEVEGAVHLINVFNRYQLTEAPQFKDGHTFSVGAAAPQFRLELRPYVDYDPEAALYNPYGMWYMKPV